MKGKKTVEFMIIPGAYSADLRGRQSVRTTFRLTPRCIDALSLLAGQLGIKQKSLFDHLMDDDQALKAIARDIDAQTGQALNRVSKTFVISRRTLESLEHISKRYQAPRDALVEYSIERIMPLLEEERKKHEERKALLEHLEKLLISSKELLKEADSTLERDDPVLERVYHMYRAVKSGCEDIEDVVNKGRKLEEF